MIKTSVIVLIFSFLTAFSAVKSDSPLYNTKWTLAKLHSKEIASKRAFIQFDGEKGNVSGNGSCNRFGGSFTIKNDSLAFSRLFSTKMYCTDVQEIENEYLDALHKVTRYEITGVNLRLYDDTTLLLEFVKE